MVLHSAIEYIFPKLVGPLNNPLLNSLEEESQRGFYACFCTEKIQGRDIFC